MKPYSKLCTFVVLACLGISQLYSPLAAANQPPARAKVEIERPQGGVSGGGGNAIMCNDNKYYSYDFILTEGSKGIINPEIATMRSAEEILKYIAFNLKPKLPALAAGLEDFIQGLNISVFDITGSRRLWIQGSNPLSRLYDESNIRIPISCRDREGRPKVYQAVVRVTNSFGVTQYNADPTVLSALYANSPLQLSFLYIHEWLRDYTSDTNTLMNVDRMFHEKAWLSATPEGLMAALRKYGMSPVPVLSFPAPRITIPGSTRGMDFLKP